MFLFEFDLIGFRFDHKYLNILYSSDGPKKNSLNSQQQQQQQKTMNTIEGHIY